MNISDKNKIHKSERIIVGILLAISGGYMDAYTYIFRGKVFANAQTGNMILFGINLSEGNFDLAFHYFVPVIAFIGGLCLSQIVKYKHEKHHVLHWKQISILIEAVILMAVGFVPNSLNWIANCMVSFACGIQVQSFRKVHGNTFATTMCIGNIRMSIDLLFLYFYEKDNSYLKTSIIYFSVIASFIIGAVMGRIGAEYFGGYSILISSAILILAFFIMCENTNKPNKVE